MSAANVDGVLEVVRVHGGRLRASARCDALARLAGMQKKEGTAVGAAVERVLPLVDEVVEQLGCAGGLVEWAATFSGHVRCSVCHVFDAHVVTCAGVLYGVGARRYVHVFADSSGAAASSTTF